MRLFTGLQPSGALHIGNYFAALKPMAELSKEYPDTMLMVADYHALTTVRNASELRTNILNTTKDFIAAGVDPEQAIIFKQSDVREHTELAWVFQCLVTVPFLQQAHAYKDKVAKGLEANAGLFAYPMLMAADILLYDTDVVPVGADQRQHVEYAREAAAKFNHAYGDVFKEPRERIIEAIATVPGTDGKKMSKSYGNTIPLFGTKDEIAKAVMSIVTDSGEEGAKNVRAIHELLASGSGARDLDGLYAANTNNYKGLKEALIEDIETLIAPMRQKRDSITDAEAKKVLESGTIRARERAEAKMEKVRAAIGISL